MAFSLSAGLRVRSPEPSVVTRRVLVTSTADVSSPPVHRRTESHTIGSDNNRLRRDDDRRQSICSSCPKRGVPHTIPARATYASRLQSGRTGRRTAVRRPLSCRSRFRILRFLSFFKLRPARVLASKFSISDYARPASLSVFKCRRSLCILPAETIPYEGIPTLVSSAAADDNRN